MKPMRMIVMNKLLMIISNSIHVILGLLLNTYYLILLDKIIYMGLTYSGYLLIVIVEGKYIRNSPSSFGLLSNIMKSLLLVHSIKLSFLNSNMNILLKLYHIHCQLHLYSKIIYSNFKLSGH